MITATPITALPGERIPAHATAVGKGILATTALTLSRTLS